MTNAVMHRHAGMHFKCSIAYIKADTTLQQLSWLLTVFCRSVRILSNAS